MADVSKVIVDNVTYNLKDTEARNRLEAFRQTVKGGVHWIGETTTPLSDGSTTSTISITDSNGDAVDHDAEVGDEVFYNDVTYAWSGSKWDMLGSSGDLQALAYKNQVEGTVTSAGKISATYTGAETDISVNGVPSGAVQVTPNTEVISQIKTVGSKPSWKASVANETLSFSFTSGSSPTKEDVTVATGIKSATFTGSPMTSTGQSTSKGTVNATFTGETATIVSK